MDSGSALPRPGDNGHMIARIWRGWAAQENAGDYQRDTGQKSASI
jgi:hypothetical protein